MPLSDFLPGGVLAPSAGWTLARRLVSSSASCTSCSRPDPAGRPVGRGRSRTTPPRWPGVDDHGPPARGACARRAACPARRRSGDLCPLPGPRRRCERKLACSARGLIAWPAAGRRQGAARSCDDWSRRGCRPCRSSARRPCCARGGVGWQSVTHACCGHCGQRPVRRSPHPRPAARAASPDGRAPA